MNRRRFLRVAASGLGAAAVGLVLRQSPKRLGDWSVEVETHYNWSREGMAALRRLYNIAKNLEPEPMVLHPAQWKNYKACLEEA